MIKKILLLFFLGYFGILSAQPQTAAEQMPYFPGCDQFKNGSEKKRTCSNQALVNFISNYLLYPEAAQMEQVEGTVYVSFVIAKDGSIEIPTILRDIGSGCGDAALDVLRKMPTWEPGLDKDIPVSVKLNLPIQFSFTPSSPEEEDVPYKVHWGILKTNQVSRDQLRGNTFIPVQVRDLFGNDILISELLFVYEKKRTYLDAKSNGRISKQMEKVIRRAKKGGTFSVVATVQKNGKFVDVERTFNLIE